MKTLLWLLAAVSVAAADDDDDQKKKKKSACVSITSPANGAALSGAQVDVVVSFGCQEGCEDDDDDRVYSIELRVNGEAAASFAVPKKKHSGTHTFPGVNLSAFADQSVTLVARAYLSKNKKKSVDSAAVTVLVDLSPPTILLSPSEGRQLVGPGLTLTATYSDAGVGVDLSTFKAFLDGAELTSSFAKGPAQATLTISTPTPDGPHVFRAEIQDKVGRSAQASSLFRLASALATVGVDGGTVQVTNPSVAAFGASLEIPPGAILEDVQFSIEQSTSPSPLPPGFTAVGPVIDFRPDSAFLLPANLTVPYSPAAVAAQNVPLQGVRLLTFDVAQGLWILVPITANDTQAGRLSTSVSELSGQEFVVVTMAADPNQTLVGSTGAAVADGVSFTTLTLTPRVGNSLLGPNQNVSVTISIPGATATVHDLGNGVYQVFITSPAAGTATIRINDEVLPAQTVAFTPMPASFGISGFSNPMTAGVAGNLTITARDAGGSLLPSFAGAVEIGLNGVHDATSHRIFPETFVAVFTPADAGIVTLPNALLFAQWGTREIRVTYLTIGAPTSTQTVWVNSGPPASIAKLAGDLQSGPVRSVLPQPLAVKVTDLFGNPVPGAQVLFSVRTGGARFTR